MIAFPSPSREIEVSILMFQGLYNSIEKRLAKNNFATCNGNIVTIALMHQ